MNTEHFSKLEANFVSISLEAAEARSVELFARKLAACPPSTTDEERSCEIDVIR